MSRACNSAHEHRQGIFDIIETHVRDRSIVSWSNLSATTSMRRVMDDIDSRSRIVTNRISVPAALRVNPYLCSRLLLLIFGP